MERQFRNASQRDKLKTVDLHPNHIKTLFSLKSFFELVTFLVLSFFFGSLHSCNLEAKGLQFDKLTCDYYTNPIGIENMTPAFSWTVTAEQVNQSQSAYQLLVASSPENLNEGDADLWDSEKIESDQSVFVPFEGKELLPISAYYWKVKIWDQDGNETKWSPVQYFETGLGNEENWLDAKWITISNDKRASAFRNRDILNRSTLAPKTVSSNPVGYFRKEFQNKKQLEKAQIYIAGLGYYEAFLNGTKIGDHVLDPSSCNYDDHSFYTIFDVTERIKTGINTCGLILGNGFYGQDIAFSGDLDYGKPAIKALLKLYYSDGTTANIITNNSWKVSTGPIVFDNVYAGETYDARYELTDWDKSGFNDSTWENAKIDNPIVGSLQAQLMPPIRKTKTLQPVRIFQAANKNWIIDFGQNIAGWVKINVNEKVGQKISIKTVEALTRKGDAISTGSLGAGATGVIQEEIYICKGSGNETWEPRFTYHGFQFAEISGLTEKPSVDDFQAVLVHTDLEETGSFVSSNELFNKMVEVSKWTIVDNLHSFPEDCPHREKCGWLGDAQVTAQFCLYNYNIASFYNKYVQDIKSQLTPTKGHNNKVKTFHIPTQVAPGKRKSKIAALDWGIAEIYIPWYNYLHNGDFGLVKRHYPDFKEMVAYYLTFKNDKGTIDNGLGDWCPPLWDRANNPSAMECDPFISASAYFYDILGIMQLFAVKMEDTDYAQSLMLEQQKLKTAFNQQFLKSIGGKDAKWYGSQTATVMALQFGMVPDSLLSQVTDGLKYDIVTNKNYHHSTGIHGNRYIYSLLNDLDEQDLSYTILTNPDFPSQTYILNCGLNTWPERQWEWGNGIEWDRSLNHPMHSGFAAYFYESVAGIKPMASHPGFKKFKIEPEFLEKVDFVESSIESPYGKIATSWKKSETKILLTIKIPFNTEALIQLPINDLSSLEIKNEFAGKVISYEKLSDSKNNDLVLGSGEYTISFEIGHPQIQTPVKPL